MPIPLPTEAARRDLHAAIGEAITAYSRVEAWQASLLAVVLHVDKQAAKIVFHSVPNIRSRIEMFGGLLNHAYGDTLDKYWEKCGEFLQRLSTFRNAVAHWEVKLRISIGGKVQKPSETVLYHPIPGKKTKPLTTADFPAFVDDCKYIEKEIREFAVFLYGARDGTTLPDKYLQPTIRPNRADLLPPQNPKAQQPQRPPSQGKARKGPKPSAKQRRQRALAEMARKKRP